jgi:hypothetical protein
MAELEVGNEVLVLIDELDAIGEPFVVVVVIVFFSSSKLTTTFLLVKCLPNLKLSCE